MIRRFSLLVVLLTTTASSAQDRSPTNASDLVRLIHVGAATPDTIAVTIEHGKISRGQQIPFKLEPTDNVEGGKFTSLVVQRDGQPLGALVGPGRDILFTYDTFVDQPIPLRYVMQTESWKIGTDQQSDAPRVVRVSRKSKPIGEARTGSWQFAFPQRHTLYLTLDRPLKSGTTYSFQCDRLPGTLASISLQFDQNKTRSDSVQVSHIGFAPGDVKIAFLSAWLGSGGPATFDENTPFQIVDDTTGNAVFSGKSLNSFKANTIEDDQGFSHTFSDVHRLDFTQLTTPGTYRVVVAGVGSSYPFQIAAGVYRTPAVMSARGLFHHRSGIALGPPHTNYVRPRPMHPDDGLKVWQASFPLYSEDGIVGQDEIFIKLQSEAKTTTVPGAWGGWMDAGDWDQREAHIPVSRLLFEIAELYPTYVAGLNLNIPESTNDLPDLIDESLFNLDLYRRLQHENGGVCGWVEMTEHPRFGEGSWNNSLDVFVTAPDSITSDNYAATAAQAATVLRSLGKAAEADAWLDSAKRAWNFARNETELTSKHANNVRVLAAVMLYRETGDSTYHEDFLKHTVLKDASQRIWVWQNQDEREAAFVYARLSGVRPVDETIRTNAINGTVREATDWGLRGNDRTAYRWGSDPGMFVGWSTVTAPNVVSNVRAYQLTKDPRHKQAVAIAMGYTLGANPLNQAMMTGLGPDPVRHVLHADSRYSGQAVPDGITVYGPIDTRKFKSQWFFNQMGQMIYPAYDEWPSVEAFYDVFWILASNEYTVMQTIGPVTYYLTFLSAEAQK